MRTKRLLRYYMGFVTLVAPLYGFAYKILSKVEPDKSSKRLVLLISRPQDIELLIGLYEKAVDDRRFNPTFWVIGKCAKRFPSILNELAARNAEVELTVGTFRLRDILNKLMRTDVFLSTVESTAAWHKLPYIITRLANRVGLATYTLQHGFENIGLTYRDDVHGPETGFAAKTVLTWGLTEELPAWVDSETRGKAVAVGCPKALAMVKNEPTLQQDERPIIGVFDNLHWHRYDETYVAAFLSHLEEAARLKPELRFILKSHPVSVRNRSQELAARLRGMRNVEVADWLADREPALTTPWLLTHALGVITTPSTIALDGALAGIPVAVAGYGLDLGYYAPLQLLDSHEDWQAFLDGLTNSSGYSRLRLHGEQFLNRVLVPGDPVTKILNLMAEMQPGGKGDL